MLFTNPRWCSPSYPSVDCIKAGFSVTFNKGMCTIRNPKSKTIATIPNSDGLYKVIATKRTSKTKTANTAMSKISISEAHRKLGHVACSAIKHAVSKGLIGGIDLDLNSKLDFCEACAKAKSATQPFPKESETRAEKFGEQVHWDLWGPASVKSLNGNHYVTTRSYTHPPIPEGFRSEFQTPTGISGIRLVLFWL